MNGLVGLMSLFLLLSASVLVTTAGEQLIRNVMAGRSWHQHLLEPLFRVHAMLAQQCTSTEAPDRWNWKLAPLWYLSLALIGLALVPIDDHTTLLGLDTSLVLWGSVEALTVVSVFLHGWSPNSFFPLIGAYRYVATGLPIMLVSMFVLIAAALPAESLDVRDIVSSQVGAWNVVRQPLGLPLFLLLGLSLTLRGPFDYADSADLLGGTSAEDSGRLRATWQLARLCMLVSFSAMAATVFLGGYLGPGLPGLFWLMLKTLLVALVLTVLTHLLARLTVSRMLTLIWTVLLPLSFLGLLQAGLEAI